MAETLIPDGSIAALEDRIDGLFFAIRAKDVMNPRSEERVRELLPVCASVRWWMYMLCRHVMSRLDGSMMLPAREAGPW